MTVREIFFQLHRQKRRATKFFVRCLAIIGLVLLAFGCVKNRLPDAPTEPLDDAEFSEPEPVSLPGLDSDPAEPLKLLAGDVIQLTTVSANTRVYKGLIVDAKNQLHVPLAGDIVVGGLSLSEGEKRIEKALRRYEPYVRVNVIIEKATGHAATVLGAVKTPGRVTIHPGMRLADLFAAAGGPAIADSDREQTVIANLDAARLVREGKAVPVGLPEAIKGDPRHNIRVRAGDQLYVPPGTERLIMVIGDVNDPQPLAYRRGMRLSEALARAGGLSVRGDRNDIRIVRGPLRNPKVYVASVKDLVNNNTPDVVLAPGDIIYVTESWIASTGQLLNAIAPIISLAEAAAIVSLSRAIAQ